MKLGYNEKKIRLVHIGFDLPVIPNGKHAASNMKRVLGIDSDRLIIGCIGRYHPDKDYPTIIKAASIIRQTHPNVIFILVGPGLTSKNTSLMDHIEEHGQTDSFILLGERDDITNCLYLMDIFCLPSKTEAFPLVLGEAMAAARPVVSTDVGDARVMIGETGVVVPPGNPQRLAWALSKLIVISSEQREMMGIRSRNRIEERHTMKVMIGDIERIYHECLLSRSNRS
jgi:glycosyltransferase involved in cell wall biosynthesis